MKKLLLGILFLLVLIPFSYADSGYKANYWSSWASVTTQITWLFPYNSREIDVHNGSSVPICVGFNGTPMNTSCTSPANPAGNFKLFQVGANQILHLEDLVQSSVTLQSMGAAASPVSVVVGY